MISAGGLWPLISTQACLSVLTGRSIGVGGASVGVNVGKGGEVGVKTGVFVGVGEGVFFIKVSVRISVGLAGVVSTIFTESWQPATARKKTRIDMNKIFFIFPRFCLLISY